MTTARADLIDRVDGGFYHVGARCVRRAWLCGVDPYTNQDFSHRRAWVEARFFELAEHFACIDVYAYAVMSNHYHLIIHYQPRRTVRLSDEEVARAWLSVCGPHDADRFETRMLDLLDDQEQIALYRERLGDLSWFMRFLNESVARRANKEDDCTGRFWEGRFGSHPLLDDAAVFACMVYAELNPMRGGMTRRFDVAPFTSLYRRMNHQGVDVLYPLGFDARREIVPLPPDRVVFTTRLEAYVSLVAWTAVRHAGTRQPQMSHEAASLTRTLGLGEKTWLGSVNRFGQRRRAFGSVQDLRSLAEKLKQRWLWGVGEQPRIPST